MSDKVWADSHGLKVGDCRIGALGDWMDSRSYCNITPALHAKWITRTSELEPGLLFYANEANDIFGPNPEVALTASLVSDHESYCIETDFSAELMLLVTGFKLPAPGHVNWSTVFTGEQHTRGNVRDGNLREVYEYVGCNSGLPIRAGLTVHTYSGTWSSWPAHEFETQSLMAPTPLYPRFEEVFAFVTQPMGMWGIQVSSPARTDTRYEAGVRAFTDRQITYPILGAHPVVAAPGTRLAYLWIYTGGLNKFGPNGEQH
jgi:5-deoxy-D-glucuronate isomerase